MAETPTFGRYAEIPYDQMTPGQQEGYRSMIEAAAACRARTRSTCTTRKLAKVMGPLGAHFRTGYSLSEREREIAVCIINSKWHSIYPTNAHERAGKAAGLPSETVEAILSGLPTSFDDKREQVIYEMATCLTNSRWVSKGLYDRAVEALGHVGITDVITLDGLLHQRVDDAGLLRRPGRRDRHRAGVDSADEGRSALPVPVSRVRVAGSRPTVPGTLSPSPRQHR